MRLYCNHCGGPVSTEVPDATVVRAVIECPECVEKKAGRERALAAKEQEATARERARCREEEVRPVTEAAKFLLSAIEEWGFDQMDRDAIGGGENAVRVSLAAVEKKVKETPTSTCKWTVDDDGVWHPGCGANPYDLLTGTPSENSMRYCHFCGKPIDEIARKA